MKKSLVVVCVALVLLQASNAFSQGSQKNTATVLIGDSQMYGFVDYPQLFPKNTVNLAITGSDSGETLQAVSKVTSYSPKTVFLLTGTNDIKVGSIDIFSHNYDAILTSIQTALPETKVYAQAILPQTAGYKAIGDFNGTIRNVASTHSNTVFLDFTSSFSASDGSLKSEFSKDGMHLNPTGYQYWGKLLAQYF